ncbi:P-II family nitrogen regulator [Nitrincola alkalilacustris]|uniref:P-II family nitrogen regulator n=1 Tax=Nitrincola alkalilacustris TaxID=1571224 RepID=UPI00124E17AF|nr:P-II family nitrogen regulator [Nitrincola alkalilacustris]
MDFKLIMVFVDEDKRDVVLDASRQAGATGSTIITNARGQGLQKAIGILGLEILNPRDVLLILAESRRVDQVMKAIVKAGELDESLGTGVALQIDVEKALGLSEHIKALEASYPPPVGG